MKKLIREQVEHLRTYPTMRDRERAGQLKLHGWWFDIATAEVLALDGAQGRFVVIDEDEAARIVARLEER